MTMHFKTAHTQTAPVVALHSSASSAKQWRQFESDLNGRYRFFAYDLPGYGKNPVSVDVTLSTTAHVAARIIAQIEELGERVHLVGHSNGGGVALKVALLRPDLVKSLTLYEPATFHFLKDGDTRSQQAFDDINLIFDLVAASNATSHPEIGMASFLNFWNGAGFWKKLPDAAKTKFAEMASSVIADFERSFAETWTLGDLASLKIPTLIMTGMESPDVAQRSAKQIAQHLPNAQLAILPELGHMAPAFNPEWINARIVDHIARIERSATPVFWPQKAAQTVQQQTGSLGHKVAA